jgi:transcriptional regulator with XRE-family HTH domain
MTAETVELEQRSSHPVATDVDVLIGQNIASLRMKHLWSQEDFGNLLTEATGYPWYQNIISRIELGKRPLRLYEAIALAKLFGVTVDALAMAGEIEVATQVQAQRVQERIAEISWLEGQLRGRKRVLQQYQATGKLK